MKHCEAMISLAIQLGWIRWACVTCLAFYGIARAGEPLRATRGDLLLPCDVLCDVSTGAYLTVRAPKTAFRGAGRVQHLVVKEVAVIAFLERWLRDLDPSVPLFRGSPAAYRRRWDYILRRLGIPATAKITPGSLRGGGAVMHYRRGINIQDLMWRMRLRSLGSLECYLQEVAGAAVITTFSSDTRRRVAAASALFPFALQWGGAACG